MIAKNRRVYLDLGNVQVLAQVKLNGKDLGILWKPPFRLDVTDAVQAGDNALEVRVTNNWVNRLIGDEQLPEDSKRHPERQPRRVAQVAAGRQAQPDRPAHLQHLASLEQGFAADGIRPVGPGEDIRDRMRGTGVLTRRSRDSCRCDSLRNRRRLAEEMRRRRAGRAQRAPRYVAATPPLRWTCSTATFGLPSS